MRHRLFIPAATALLFALAACTQDELAGDNRLPEGEYPVFIRATGLSVEATPLAAPSTRAAVDGDWQGVTSVALKMGDAVKEYTVTASTDFKSATLSRENAPHYWTSRDPITVSAWWPRPLQIISVFLGMSLFVSVYGIVQHFTGVVPTEAWVDNDAFPELKTRVISTLVNPNILGGYLVLVISLITGLLSTSKEKMWQLVLGSGILIAGLCLLYTYSRGNWVALAVGLLLFCVCFCRRALLPLIGIGILGMWFARGAVWHRIISIFGTEDTSVALRFAYLESTLFIIKEHPWGVGWYGYQFIYPEYDFYLNNPDVIMYHCHNLLLNITAELGWHGLAVFLLLWFCIIWKAAELARFGKSRWLQGFGRGYLMASAGILVGGLTDHVYFNMQMGLLFWLFAILIMVCSEFNRKLTKA